MSRINFAKRLQKAQTKIKLNEDATFREKFKKQIEQNIKEKEKANKTPEKPTTKPAKTSFFGGGSGFFAKTPEVDFNKEPLGNYYEDRKKILFGNIDIVRQEYYISQFLLKSQEKINSEYSKMSSGSSFFFDVPLKVYNFTLGMKENIANFCLIIKLYLLYKNKEKALEIYLLMCKQNKKKIEFIYNKLNLYCKKVSPAMLKFSPFISKMFILILSCFIKLSGIFCKTTLQNFFFTLYLKTIYILTLREINKISDISYKNDLKYHRLYFYSSCLFDSSIFSFLRYQPLSISTYILQHILELYKEKNLKENTRYEQVLILKVNYNLGLFFYIDGKNSEAINHLTLAKENLSEIVFFPVNVKNEENHNMENAGRNSAILKNQEKHILNKLTFYKGKINYLDDKNIDNMILNKFSKQSFNQSKNLRIIEEENNNNELQKKQSLCIQRNSSSLFLGIRKIELKQPLLFDHIKKKISLEIELLLSQIELNRKNFRGALEHINLIIGNKKSKDDFDSESILRKKTFNMINKTFKNLKSFQGAKIKKLNINTFGNATLSKNEDNKNKNNNNLDDLNNNFVDETILTDNDIKLIKLLLERIEQDYYNEHSHIDQRNDSFIRKRNSNIYFAPQKAKTVNYSSFKEMEKFFIFICNLSIYQLKILNESQPKFCSNRNDLPIIFSNQFQDCLTLSQRLALTQLQTLSLSRYIILIDSNKDICPENLDYKYMKFKMKTSEENEEEKEYKFNEELKGKTINSRKSNDSMMLNGTNINTLSIKRKKEIEFEDESTMFDILLTKIKTKKNKKFIETHKKCILQILNNLSENDKKLFQNSPNLLKNMLKNIEKKIRKNNNINSKSFSSEYSSSFLENNNFSFSSSQELINY